MRTNRSVGIIGTGSYLPSRVVPNSELVLTLDTTDEWIIAKTGITERRIASDDEATSDLAAKAAQRALESSGCALSDIDLIITATSSPDMIQPSTACLMQSKLGITHDCPAFDISAVCCGFIYAISMAADLMKANPQYKKVLVVGAETYSRILDYSDRNTCIFFGDGAGAAVLADVDDGYGILASRLKSDGRGADVVKCPAGGSRLPASHDTVTNRLHSFRMVGPMVYKFVTKVFAEIVTDAVNSCGLKVEDIDFVIAHQANLNLIKKGMASLGLPLSKTYTNVHKFANTAGASVPIALDEAVRLGKVKEGDLVVLVGFGGGLTWGADVIRWTTAGRNGNPDSKHCNWEDEYSNFMNIEVESPSKQPSADVIRWTTAGRNGNPDSKQCNWEDEYADFMSTKVDSRSIQKESDPIDGSWEIAFENYIFG